jgi:hypothetical protein
MVMKRSPGLLPAYIGALRSARCVLVVVALASLGGCGSDDAGVATGPEPEGPDLVACGVGGPTFPRSALDTLHDAPPPDGDMVVGLRPFLESEEGVFWPQDGWRVVSSGDGVTVLLADADSQLWFQTLELSDGAWRWAGSSATDECPLRVPAPEGYNEVEWRLDPDAKAPNPTSTEIEVLVHENACASGEPVGDRLVGPDVEVTANEVRVGFVAEAQEGDFNCPSNPETPVAIQLEEALGDRALVDPHDLGTDLRDYL